MPRANGNDLAELFGYAPDDDSDAARKQWKSQKCPFTEDTCIKHSHPQRDGSMVVYGTCSVLNKSSRTGTPEEVIICPNRLYAEKYAVVKACFFDAHGSDKIQIYSAKEFSKRKKRNTLPAECGVLLGKFSNGEIGLTRLGDKTLSLALDWVVVRLQRGTPDLAVPCEVQSIDTTGNYHAAWEAYSSEADEIPDSKHGMNWANVWKRLIPQLILKGVIASASALCHRGGYFVVPARVYREFGKWLGNVPTVTAPAHGVLTVMTYALGKPVPRGSIRSIDHQETVRMNVTDFAKAFGSGQEVKMLGPVLDTKIRAIIDGL